MTTTYTLLDEPRLDSPITHIVKLSIPNVATCFAHYSSSVVATLVVSSLNVSTELAAYGLANLIWYVFGISFGSGLTSALDTLVSQSMGAGNHHLPPVHLNRARIVIMTVAFVPGLITLFFTKEILVAAGQDVQVARYSSDYITGALYGLLPLYLNLCSAAFLRSLKLPEIPLLANVIAALVHIGPCIWLVDRYGLYGAGIAAAINSWTRFFVLEVYMALHPELGAHRWTPEAFSWLGLVEYIKLALPSAALYCSESWAFELQAVVAGWVSTSGLASHVAGVSVICIAFRVPQGISQSMATLVGSALGNGKPMYAQRLSRYGLWIALMLSSVIGLTILIFRHSIIPIYSRDVTVLPVMDTVMAITGIFVVIDAFATVQEGILRGLKLQSAAMKYKIISMFAIMLPTGLVLSRLFGVPGIWIGSVIGVSSSSFWYYRIIQSCDFAHRSAVAIKDNQE